MTTYRISCIPGDGVGPEVIAQGKRVLDAVSERDGFEIDWLDYGISATRYLASGQTITDEEFDELGKRKCIYFGAVGDPRVKPGVLERSVLLAIRFRFDQYVNLRPVRLLEGVQTPLTGRTPKDINFVCVRENTEDFYVGLGLVGDGAAKKDMFLERLAYSVNLGLSASVDPPDEFGVQAGIITRKSALRLFRYAFRYAASHKMNKVTVCDKINAMSDIYSVWQRAFLDVAKENPSVETEEMLVDTMSMWFVRDPSVFQVVALPNLFGDILTDLAAAIQGGMGLAPGANLNPDGGISMFEPIHGSAPQLKGKNMANPVAAILAGAMMLDQLGLRASAEKVEGAVENVLKAGKIRTQDLGGTSGTVEMGESIAKELGRSS